jgi:hypothetical protein
VELCLDARRTALKYDIDVSLPQDRQLEKAIAIAVNKQSEAERLITEMHEAESQVQDYKKKSDDINAEISELELEISNWMMDQDSLGLNVYATEGNHSKSEGDTERAVSGKLASLVGGVVDGVAAVAAGVSGSGYIPTDTDTSAASSSSSGGTSTESDGAKRPNRGSTTITGFSQHTDTKFNVFCEEARVVKGGEPYIIYTPTSQ